MAHKFENMKVASCQMTDEDWGTETDPNSDYNIAIQFASFHHHNACELIIFLGTEDCDATTEMKEQGFSDNFITKCKTIKKAGYDYVCFYV